MEGKGATNCLHLPSLHAAAWTSAAAPAHTDPRCCRLLATPQDLGSAAWKGRGALLADVLRLSLCHRDDAVPHIRSLAINELAQVPGAGGSVAALTCSVGCCNPALGAPLGLRACAHTCCSTLPRTHAPPSQVTDSLKAEEARKTVDWYPSLSGGTVAVWFRAACDQLQASWEAVVASAAGAEKHKQMGDGEALESIVGRMQARTDDTCWGWKAGRSVPVCARLSPPCPHSPRRPPSALLSLRLALPPLQECASAFSALLTVVKCQPARTPVHVQALKSGGGFLETFFKALPFWAAAYRQHGQAAAFQSMVRRAVGGRAALRHRRSAAGGALHAAAAAGARGALSTACCPP